VIQQRMEFQELMHERFEVVIERAIGPSATYTFLYRV
jgi:hypothetical protein